MKTQVANEASAEFETGLRVLGVTDFKTESGDFWTTFEFENLDDDMEESLTNFLNSWEV